MCHGYHRRELGKLRRLRLVLAEVRNGLRAPETDAQTPQQVMELPGDLPAAPQFTEEEYLAELARVADLDKDLL